jgi:hypothetical protein
VCVCVCVSIKRYPLQQQPSYIHIISPPALRTAIRTPVPTDPSTDRSPKHLPTYSPSTTCTVAPHLASAKLTRVPVLSLQIPAYHRAPYLPYPTLLYPPHRSALLPAPPRPNRRPCKLPPSVLRHPTQSCTRASGISSSPTLHKVRSADCGPVVLTVGRGCAQGSRLARQR